MKKITILLLLTCICLVAKSQDVITKKNGDEINANVLEVNPTTIKYKKSDNPDGPAYTLDKSEILMVKYKNGTKDVMGSNNTSSTTYITERKEQVMPASGNLFTAKGTVELGGDISFSYQTPSEGDGSISTFALNPYVGFMLTEGFELGFIPAYTTTSINGGLGTSGTTVSSFNLLLAPAYNINAGKAYPFFEFLIGYNSINEENTTEDGLAIGVSGGVKAQIGGNGLLLFGIRYLHQSYGVEGVSESLNTVLVSAGARFFISPKR